MDGRAKEEEEGEGAEEVIFFSQILSLRNILNHTVTNLVKTLFPGVLGS